MLPTILAREIETGLKHFIKTGFETTTPYFKGMFSRFADEPGNLSKGPYLSLQLPFLPGDGGRDYFQPHLDTEHPPHLHQQRAWDRLTSRAGGKSTIVATGTGSGKTECFMYPLLDHCARHTGQGIKAIIIYPMNALATDQAERFAKSIYQSPELKGRVSVGLFVGGSEENVQKSMGPDKVISDKHTLRQAPPDILLTNYKMLDYLLIRPKDQLLWRFNTSETLRYLVVDELHTFDGAQGTDLACLLRRIKARVKTPHEHLICVGTSATLGDEAEGADLCRYAEQIFQEPFDEHAIVGETRQNVQQFMGDCLIEHQFFPPAKLKQRLNPANYPDMRSYIKAQYELIFSGLKVDDPDDVQWRKTLGQQLKGHVLFGNLLRLLAKQPCALSGVANDLAKTLPLDARELSYDLLNSLCALISHALDPLTGLPLVNLRLQYWVRELRRMVTPLSAEGEPGGVSLSFADDMKHNRDTMCLPLVQCNECHATAWIGHQLPGQEQVRSDLRAIYNSFFSNSAETVMLLPLREGEKLPTTRGLEKKLCRGCGKLQTMGDTCQACGEDKLIRVFVPDNCREKKGRNGNTYLVTERNCPCCQSRNSMLVFGARAASLASIAIHHSFATQYNDDKKLLTFSDSVQDAAHRAGFFSARTWQNNLRMAMAQALCATQGENARISVADFFHVLPDYWRDSQNNPRAFSEEEFICQFIAPNMQWFADYQTLEQKVKLPAGSNLGDDVRKRLTWEILAEIGYRARIGRSLQRTGVAGVGFAPEDIAAVALELQRDFVEHFGLQHLEQTEVEQFILGFLYHLLWRGAVYHSHLDQYINDGGKNFLLKFKHFLPNLAPQSASPTFLSTTPRHQDFDCVIRRHTKSWYEHWVFRALGRDRLLTEGIEADLYTRTLNSLRRAGIMVERDTKLGGVWGLNPHKMFLSASTRLFATPAGANRICVAQEMADFFTHMPSLELNDPDVYQPVEDKDHWLADLYRKGEIERVISAEHTGLLTREERENIEQSFIHREHPWQPNLLSATPTLEMGIDIGDLSSVLLCSVPPAQANYLQRVGRSGRKDGNSFNLTFAVGAPHDLYFYADPLQMMAGRVDAPGVFLNASAVVERQLTAFCLDRWVGGGVDESAIPQRMKVALDQVEGEDKKGFPYTFLEHTSINAAELYEDFIALFGDEFSDPTREHLRRFLVSESRVEGLEMRIIRRLHELVEERKSLRKQIDALKRYIDKEGKKPQDEVTRDNIEQARRERSGMQDILRSINARETFNFLTDEGLIPNYTFPEAGVSLRSVIYRKRKDPEEGESAYINYVYEYERAGGAAISELAPNNRFYAGGRQVRIEQVNLGVSAVEDWRFCRFCSYAQNLVSGDVHDTCPRCGDIMWRDSGQKCQMIRLRQVMANTSDRDSRIGDDSDDREPTFYTRQMLADFDPGAVENAWRIAGEMLPFGFEYIRKATFREMNFGEYSGRVETNSVAGVEAARPGFVVCKYCGMVQKRSNGSEDARQKHAFTCKTKDRDDPQNLIDCLYLYREFSSEAVRILLPVSVFTGSERYLNSFIAAIQLGLKKKFGGKVDHLRMMSYDEPIGEGDSKRQFLMLYDSVPGGTGYLHELLHSHTRLLEVLRLARDAMVECSCHHDPLKDGCYRCLLAYRNSYGMESTSRDTAISLLSDILKYEDDFEAVDSIREVTQNPLFDSELEARFIDAIKRLALEGMDIQIQAEVVHGKPGYFLRINDLVYTLEPQVNLGGHAGVDIASCADFYICPARESSQIKPVAVFLDGFSFHNDIAGVDSAKRMALVQSGTMWQWSLSWDDVNQVFVKSAEARRNPFVENLHPEMQQVQKALESSLGIAEFTRLSVVSPLEQLLFYLAHPDVEQWRNFAFVRTLGWLEQGSMFDAEVRVRVLELFRASSPEHFSTLVEDMEGSTAFGGLHWNTEDALLRILLALPEAAITDKNPLLPAVNIVLDDRKPEPEDGSDAYKLAWQAFLKSYNLLQFLPRVAWTTSTAIERGTYGPLTWKDPLSPQREDSEEEAVTDPGWDEVLEEVLEEFRPGVEKLLSLGVALPEVGYELQLESGEVVAEAEIAWPENKVAGLSPEQLEFAGCFTHQGWETLSIDEGVAWVEQIHRLLEEME